MRTLLAPGRAVAISAALTFFSGFSAPVALADEYRAEDNGLSTRSGWDLFDAGGESLGPWVLVGIAGALLGMLFGPRTPPPLPVRRLRPRRHRAA